MERGCENDGSMPLLTAEDLWNFEKIRERLILRLIGKDRNQELLSTCLHRDYLDLAVTYRVLARRGEGAIATVQVDHSLAQCWNMPEGELYTLALANTLRLFPPVVMNVTAYMAEWTGLVKVPADMPPFLYVCTNDCAINGATVLCDEETLAAFARHCADGFYILPSSVHEVLLLPKQSGFCAKQLLPVVRAANRSVVAEEEILSDSVYYYNGQTGEIEIYSGQMYPDLLE